MTNDDMRVSKTLSHALRHEPWRYELELDQDGWADIEQVLQALREERPQWTDLQRADLERVLAIATKQRHEIDGDRIRARSLRGCEYDKSQSQGLKICSKEQENRDQSNAQANAEIGECLTHRSDLATNLHSQPTRNRPDTSEGLI